MPLLNGPSIHACYEPEAGAGWAIYELLWEAKRWHEPTFKEQLATMDIPTVDFMTLDISLPWTPEEIEDILRRPVL